MTRDEALDYVQRAGEERVEITRRTRDQLRAALEGTERIELEQALRLLDLFVVDR